MIPPDAQRAMSKRAGSTVVEVKGSHAVYVSQAQRCRGHHRGKRRPPGRPRRSNEQLSCNQRQHPLFQAGVVASTDAPLGHSSCCFAGWFPLA